MSRIRITLLCLAYLTGCLRSEGSHPPEGSHPSEGRGSPSIGSLALSYAPGSHPTDLEIGGAQRRVRARPTPRSHLDLAVLFMRRRRETSKPALMLYARDAIEAALGLESEHRAALLLRGLVHQYDHEFRAARDLAERILETAPALPDAHLLRGDAALELGDYAVAAEAYQAAVDLRPDLRSYNRAAHLRGLHGDVSGALEILEAAMEAGNPSDPESIAWCLVDQANLHRHVGRPKESLAKTEAALRLLPNYVPGLVARARTLAAVGRREEAIAVYQQALVRLPTVDSLVELAELRLEGGENAQAGLRIRQAEALAGEDPRPLAHFYARRPRVSARAIERATALSKRALEDRRDVPTWTTRGLALLRAGRLREAQAAFAKAAPLASHTAAWALDQALFAALEGEDPEKTRAQLAEALRRNPYVDPHLVAEIRSRLSPQPHHLDDAVVSGIGHP